MSARIKFLSQIEGRVNGIYVSVPACDTRPLDSCKLSCSGCHEPIERVTHGEKHQTYYMVSQLLAETREIKFDVLCKKCRIPLDDAIRGVRLAREGKQAQSIPKQEENATVPGGVH